MTFKLQEIKEGDNIITATGEGKIPFVSARDVAAVAAKALTDAKAHNTEHIILGPELLSYDDVSLYSILFPFYIHYSMLWIYVISPYYAYLPVFRSQISSARASGGKSRT